MVKVNTERIYSYIDIDNYNWLNDVAEKLSSNGYKKCSLSKIIKLGVMELRNNDISEIERKLIENGIINDYKELINNENDFQGQ